MITLMITIMITLMITTYCLSWLGWLAWSGLPRLLALTGLVRSLFFPPLEQKERLRARLIAMACIGGCTSNFKNMAEG